MKLQLLAIVVSLLSPTTAALLLSLSLPNSVCDRKTTSPSGWLLYLRLYFSRLIAHFLPCRRASRTSRFLKLIPQTPNSLYPA